MRYGHGREGQGRERGTCGVLTYPEAPWVRRAQHCERKCYFAGTRRRRGSADTWN